MERRAMMRFFTLKSINPGDIHAGLFSMYDTNALVLRTVYKWYERFLEGKIELFDNPRCGQPLHNDLAEALGAMIQECHFISCKSFVYPSGLQKLHVCVSYTTCQIKKGSTYTGFLTHSIAIEKPNEWHLPRNCSKF
jgi:hypothetical protein